MDLETAQQRLRAWATRSTDLHDSIAVDRLCAELRRLEANGHGYTAEDIAAIQNDNRSLRNRIAEMQAFIQNWSHAA